MPPEIPRVIHQVWLGPKPLPEQFARFQETWRTHHPDWEFRFWTEDTLPSDLRCRAIYERLREPVERCDLMRLEAVWREGGVYVDCDFECRRPIDPLLDGTDFFVAYIGLDRVNHALMGATKGHPILERALTEVRPREFFGYAKEATGPVFFNRLLADYPDATIYPSEFFYPANEEEREHAYAVHYADRSWQDRETLRRTLDKAFLRLEKSEQRRRVEVARLETQIGRLKAQVERRDTKLARRKDRLDQLEAELSRLNTALERTLARRLARGVRRASETLSNGVRRVVRLPARASTPSER